MDTNKDNEGFDPDAGRVKQAAEAAARVDAMIDLDGDGELSEAEKRQLQQKLDDETVSLLDCPTHILAKFLAVEKAAHEQDLNHDGHLDIVEFRALLKHPMFAEWGWSDDTVSRLVAAADTNGDGLIQYCELLPTMVNILEERATPLPPLDEAKAALWQAERGYYSSIHPLAVARANSAAALQPPGGMFEVPKTRVLSSEKAPMKTIRVHMVRHGEVYNPDCIMYGRMPGFRLSGVGRIQANQVVDISLRGASQRSHALQCSELTRQPC